MATASFGGIPTSEKRAHFREALRRFFEARGQEVHFEGEHLVMRQTRFQALHRRGVAFGVSLDVTYEAPPEQADNVHRDLIDVVASFISRELGDDWSYAITSTNQTERSETAVREASHAPDEYEDDGER